VTDPIIEHNVERLLRRCVPRVPAEQIERSLARAERRRPAPARHRWLPVAAAGTLAIAVWLALLSRPATNGTPAAIPQEQPPGPETLKEIDRLIGDLGASAEDLRLKAERRLREIGSPALPSLDKALYHENPDVRISARDLAKDIRKELAAKAAIAKAQADSAPIREGVRKVRERWTARDFTDMEEVVRDAFKPAKLAVIRYVPRKQLGTQFLVGKSNVNSRDSLSRELADALDAQDGLVFVSNADHAVIAYGSTFLFTLPDKKGWSAYVYAETVPGTPVVNRKGHPYVVETYNTRLLASADNRQVWGLDPDEIEWVDQNFEQIIDKEIQLSPHAGGGLKVEKVSAGSIGSTRGLLAGDIVKDVNGQSINAVKDLKTLFDNPALRQQSGLRITLERAGKPLVLEYRPLPR